jgi:hypothetical protein
MEFQQLVAIYASSCHPMLEFGGFRPFGVNQDSPIISVCPLSDARPSRARANQRADGSSNPGSVPVRRKST